MTKRKLGERIYDSGESQEALGGPSLWPEEG